MKKLMISIVFLSVVTWAGAASASLMYTLDITIPAQASVASSGIGMLEFIVGGGEYLTDWSYQFGDAIPATGNWIFETFGGGWATIYDNYPVPLAESSLAQMNSGRVVTITSDKPLTFNDLGFADFKGNYLDRSFYTSQGFQEAATPVPVPAAFYLLGSGLIGLLGLRRKSIG